MTMLRVRASASTATTLRAGLMRGAIRTMHGVARIKRVAIADAALSYQPCSLQRRAEGRCCPNTVLSECVYL